MALICDTGPLYAAVDEGDADHASCAALLTESVEPRLVPAPVLVELEWLVTSRLGGPVFDTVLADIESGAFRIIDLVSEDYERVRALCREYADLPLGFVDAAVLAVTERLGEPKLATLDRRHFHVVRPQHVQALALVPPERRARDRTAKPTR